MTASPIEEAIAHHEEAWQLRATGDLAGARQAARTALALLQSCCSPEDPDVVNVQVTVANLEEKLGHFDDARRLAADAAAHALGWGDPDDTEIALVVIEALVTAGNQERIAGAYDAAEKHLLRALALAETHLGSAHDEVVVVLNALGLTYKASGRFDEAEGVYRQAMDTLRGQSSPDVLDQAALLHNLAGLEHARSQPHRGVEVAEAGVALRRQVVGDGHPDLALDLGALGALYHDAGRYDEAEAVYREALPTVEATFGPAGYEAVLLLGNLANTRAAQGHHGEAEALHRRALAIQEAALGADNPEVGLRCHNLGALLAGLGRTSEGRALLLRAQAIFARFPTDHPRRLVTEREIARADDRA